MAVPWGTVVVAVVDEGLGNSAYLVDLGDGRALAVDPSRDLRHMDAAADRQGLRVVAVADTHLHADFLSGATRLAARDRAMVYGSAAGGRQFPHRGLADGEEVALGGLTLRAWATPGHTGEHMAYVLLDADRVVGVFTGGSLLVGSAARTDLVAPERTEELARLQYASLRRLATLHDQTPVYPTHGAGSFCAAPTGADRTTTIAREKATNALLRAPDEDTFVTSLLAGLGSYPPYFLRLSETNRVGPPVPPPTAGLAALLVDDVLRLDAAGAQIIDVRPPRDYAAAHMPGSLSITLRSAFATWLGWLVRDPSAPLVFVRGEGDDPEEIVWQARKIGYDNLAGELAGGVAAWMAAGQEVRSMPVLDPADANRVQVVDVRQPEEYAAGHVSGSRNVELGSLAEDPVTGLVVTMCGHGERAATGASILERAGRSDVALTCAGPDDWAAATGGRVAASG